MRLQPTIEKVDFLVFSDYFMKLYKSGQITSELKKQKEGLPTYILNDFSNSFGDAGRREISNLLPR